MIRPARTISAAAALCAATQASYSLRGMKRSEAEFMQYRRPVGFGPSSKTWPRWAPSTVQWTSSRTMSKLVSRVTSTKPGSIGLVKLGQPVPLSNLSRLSNNGVSLQTEK